MGISAGGGPWELAFLLFVESPKRISEEEVEDEALLEAAAFPGFVFDPPPAFCAAEEAAPDVGAPTDRALLAGAPELGCPEFGRDNGLFAGWELLTLGPNCRYAMTKLARSIGMIVVNC